MKITPITTPIVSVTKWFPNRFFGFIKLSSGYKAMIHGNVFVRALKAFVDAKQTNAISVAEADSLKLFHAICEATPNGMRVVELHTSPVYSVILSRDEVAEMERKAKIGVPFSTLEDVIYNRILNREVSKVPEWILDSIYSIRRTIQDHARANWANMGDARVVRNKVAA